MRPHWKIRLKDMCVIKGHMLISERGLVRCARCGKIIS